MDSNAALTLSDVRKEYGSFTAVDKLSFAVPKGSMFGLLGANGAGKTTSIRMILDIVSPTSGQISVLGSPSAALVRDRIGYLPEERGLYKSSKVLETICYFARLKGMAAGKARVRASAMLAKYGLAEFSNFKIQALSKGMNQKVQLISTVVHEPDLVILDEPFSGLDPVNQQVLEQLILDMAANGQTIIFSTHVMQHAERLCNRLLLLARGKKVFEGTVDEAKARLPQTLVIETDDDIAALRQHPLVKGICPLDAAGKPHVSDAPSRGTGRWEITLHEMSDPQQILRHCFSSGIALRSFEQRNPTLHDAFVKLVGGGEQTLRQDSPQEVAA
jgi:ABC-2 type transport system ATP-binding protein